MYHYYHKHNGKLRECKSTSFVEAHNCSYWAGAREFYDEETATPVPVLPQLIFSIDEYTNYGKQDKIHKKNKVRKSHRRKHGKSS